ncbi:MAG: MBL fold metallo-hydrolase [Thermodesulfobacteriota bacterium]|nr:MBL fold metallo-hydrolase [Thermodesulfobacteriota bacterium]
MLLTKDVYTYIWNNPYANNSNTYIIRSDFTTLIDPGHRQYAGDLKKAMEKDGIGLEEIKLIINTHLHPDHFESACEFTSMGALSSAFLVNDNYLSEILSFFPQLGMEIPKFQIDLYLREGELVLGDNLLKIFHTPGHSPCSMSIYFPEKKLIFAGDLIFLQGVGRTDLPYGSGKELKNSIEKMAELDLEFILPGHGEIVQGRENVLKNFNFIRQTFYNYI